jgi:hypothetical protein
MGLFFTADNMCDDLRANLKEKCRIIAEQQIDIESLKKELEEAKEGLEESKYTLPDFRISFDGKVWIVEELEEVYYLSGPYGPSKRGKKYKEVGKHRTQVAAEKAIADKAAGYSYYTRTGEKV